MPRKIIASLLIAVVSFSVFAVLAFTGLFNLMETRFYHPSAAKALHEKIEQDAEITGGFLEELEGRFAALLGEEAVRRSFLLDQSAEDVFERNRLFGILMESLQGLQWVRFVDARGSRLHFSTSAQDILRQDSSSLTYHSYREVPDAVPYEPVAVSEGEKPKLTVDEGGDRFIFSYPFYDSSEVYWGTALFSLSIRAAAGRLTARGRLPAGEEVSAVAEPPGLLMGLPRAGREVLLPLVSSVWRGGILNLSVLDSAGSGAALALVSAKTGGGFFVGRLVDESLFAFPESLKFILLGSFFLTVFLTVFLLFNLRQDSVTVVRNRLRQLRTTLIEEYYDRKETIDGNRWSRELELRREEIRRELKRGLRFPAGSSSAEDADIVIDRSWDDLLALIGGHRGAAFPELDRKKLGPPINPPPPGSLPAPASFAPGPSSPGAEEGETPAEEPEVLEELGPAEEVEELEVLEELPPADDAEEPEAVEELPPADDAGEPEAVEELEPAGDAGELKVVEELPPADDAEEPEAVEELEPAENAGELEAVEELLPAEAMEELSPAEGLDPASWIEFGPFPEKSEPKEIPSLEENLEIVSPLAMILSKISDTNTAEGLKQGDTKVANNTFQEAEARQGGLLKKVEAVRHLAKDDVVEERDGVHYIKKEFLNPAGKIAVHLDPKFKELIDSVIRPALVTSSNSGD